MRPLLNIFIIYYLESYIYYQLIFYRILSKIKEMLRLNSKFQLICYTYIFFNDKYVKRRNRNEKPLIFVSSLPFLKVTMLLSECLKFCNISLQIIHLLEILIYLPSKEEEELH